jgi:CRISPR-associated protein Cst1
MLNQIEVSMGEWMLTQGMVGYKRILEHVGEKVKTTPVGIIVEKHHLLMFADAFFSYFIDKYSVAKREERILRNQHYQWKNGDKSSKSQLNKKLKDIETKITKYFKNDPQGEKCLNYITNYRNKEQYHDEMDEWLDIILVNLHARHINEKLTTNFLKAIYLNPYFGQISWLNVTHNNKNVQQQKEILHTDFIQPIIEEWEFINLLNSSDETSINNWLGETQHKGLSPLKRKFKKMTLPEMKDYIEKEFYSCTLTDFPLAFLSFDEGMFSPLALSMSNSINMTWNSEGKVNLPISSLARLILFCAPAGATISNGKSIFIQFDGTFDDIYLANEHYSTEKQQDRAFDEIVFDLVREQGLKADFLSRHYLILEYESDYQSKKTLLDYMIMTPNLVKLFQNHEKDFHNIHPSHRADFIRYLLRKQDPKRWIQIKLRENMKNNYSSLEIVFMTMLRHINQLYMKEGQDVMDVKKQKSYIWFLYKSGAAIKKQLGDKKAQGIAYRLLNAVRSGNKHVFLDTVMRVYISTEQEMPSLLLEVLHEQNMDFDTVANAWIAGLISKPIDNKGELVNAEA